jgi:hypothetical protein
MIIFLYLAKDFVRERNHPTGSKMGDWYGRCIKIMTDNWIPGVTPDGITALQPLPGNATVHFLLDPDIGSWDPELVHSLFQE